MFNDDFIDEREIDMDWKWDDHREALVNTDVTLLQSDSFFLNYYLRELEDLPTLIESQADDLKVDEGRYRIWLSRCSVEDGEPFNNAVTVERCDDGRWNEIYRYEARS